MIVHLSKIFNTGLLLNLNDEKTHVRISTQYLRNVNFELFDFDGVCEIINQLEKIKQQMN